MIGQVLFCFLGLDILKNPRSWGGFFSGEEEEKGGKKGNSPRQGAHSGPILHGLIRQEAQAREHKIGKGTPDAAEAYETADTADQQAEAVMMRHVQREHVTVRTRAKPQETFHGLARHEGIRSSRDGLFEFLRDRHAV